MGIPFYFREIAIKNADTIINQLKECHRLFLDFNSIIHCCSAAYVTKQQSKENFTGLDENEIFKEIYDYTCSIIKIMNPSDLVYIAVDGVAPRAKIQQQRRRRYLSSYRTELLNTYKKYNNIPVTDWDSNCITPGTDFMQRLDVYLKKMFIKENFPNIKDIIVSGHEEYGEGEHKVMHYIKNGNMNSNVNNVQCNNIKYIDVIYGLDADLIMLSLSCKKQNIYLMRESTDFVTTKTATGNAFTKANTTKQLMYKYLDIDKLRKCVSSYLYNEDKINYMYDYIFICFMLGNDFIPSLSFLKIKDGAVGLLCDIYKKIYEKLNENLIMIETVNDKEVFRVNYKFLLKILESLSFIEDKGMKDVVEQYNSQCGINIPNPNIKKPLDKFIQDLERTPLTVGYTPKNGAIDPIKDSKWRMSYYYHLFGSISTNIMKQSSIQYIEGLLWTANYYFNMEVDMNWSYIYDYSPCISELYKYMCPISENEFEEKQKKLSKTTKFIDSTIQMLMVLPPQSRKCIPIKYQKLYSSIEYGCTHYFPVKFEIVSFLKHQLWECIPKLPYVDYDNLQKTINTIDH